MLKHYIKLYFKTNILKTIMICSGEVPSHFQVRVKIQREKWKVWVTIKKERGANGRGGIAFKAQGQSKVKSLWGQHAYVQLRSSPPPKGSFSLRIKNKLRRGQNKKKEMGVKENLSREVVETNPRKDLHPGEQKT